MAACRGNMRVKGSGEKLKKKRLEKQEETGKAETGECEGRKHLGVVDQRALIGQRCRLT